MEQADEITEPIEDEAQSEDEVLEQIEFHNTSNKTSKKVKKNQTNHIRKQKNKKTRSSPTQGRKKSSQEAKRKR